LYNVLQLTFRLVQEFCGSYVHAKTLKHCSTIIYDSALKPSSEYLEITDTLPAGRVT